MNKSFNPQNESNREHAKPGTFPVLCSWCGTIIRSTTTEMAEQMCLICHARMLNDYFQRLRKTSGEKRSSRRN